MKRIISISIVVFWLVMVSLLVQRTVGTPGSQGRLPTTPRVEAKLLSQAVEPILQPQEKWMGIYHHDRKIGYLHRQLTPTASGYQWTEQWRMKLQVLGTPQMIQTDVQANTDQHYALNDFSFRLRSAGTEFHVAGHVSLTQASLTEESKNTAPSASRSLQGTLTAGGEPTLFSFALHEPLYLPSLTQMALQNVKLQPGDVHEFSVFNPLSGQPDTITLTTVGPEILALNGKPQEVTKVATQYAGLTAHAWLDQAGNVVKEEAALGLVLLQENQQTALADGWQDNTPLDLVTSTAIPVHTALAHPRQLTQLRFTLNGLDEDRAFVFPPRQQYQDAVLTVTQEDVSRFSTYPLPSTDPAFRAELEPTPFLQSKHPKIMAQAQRIVGAEDDARQAVQLLLDWTHQALEQVPTVSVPTALAVLETRKGDCNEHAVLFTTLARAVGIPARVVVGVVYLERAFYYHAWSEVWLGQWVAVDPIFHQFPADATHVKFLEGGPEKHLALLKIIGRVGIDIVDYQ